MEVICSAIGLGSNVTKGGGGGSASPWGGTLFESKKINFSGAANYLIKNFRLVKSVFFFLLVKNLTSGGRHYKCPPRAAFCLVTPLGLGLGRLD